MDNKIKFIAMYLPQFHYIPENDLFWGKGFTDWVSVKKSKPLFEGHIQPREPLNDNYYDLSIKKNIEWQAKLSKENGLYGFGIYHYWFNNDINLLTKPAEIIRENHDIEINYFFAWDNANWKRSWSNVSGNSWAITQEIQTQKIDGPQILIPYILGREKDWENHFNEILKYFSDERYIKKDGKPVFIIMQYSKGIAEMCSYWEVLARNAGYPGMHIIFKGGVEIHAAKSDYQFHYEPIFSGWANIGFSTRVRNKIFRTLHIDYTNRIRLLSYDKIWVSLLKTARSCKNPNFYHGAFVSYDDSPRRGHRAIIVQGSCPEKFKKYLLQLAEISKEQNKEFIFITAWNEWGEGACLEPDKLNQFGYLTALKEVDQTIND